MRSRTLQLARVKGVRPGYPQDLGCLLSVVLRTARPRPAHIYDRGGEALSIGMQAVSIVLLFILFGGLD